MKKIVLVICLCLILIAGGAVLFVIKHRPSALSIIPGPSWQTPTGEYLESRITMTTGAVFLIRNGTTAAATVGTTIVHGDQLRTGPDGQVNIRFFTGAGASLDKNSSVTVTEASMDPKDQKQQVINLQLESGRIFSAVYEYPDGQASYTVSYDHPISQTHVSVKNAQFLMSASGTHVTLDDFTGSIHVPFPYGDLKDGLSSTFDMTDKNLPYTGLIKYFTSDETRNDPWIRKFRDVIVAGALGSGEVFKELIIDSSAVKFPVECNDTFQLRAYAMIQEPDGHIEKRDVTDDSLWEAGDTEFMKVDRGLVTAGMDVEEKERVIVRWDDGAKEHSTIYEYPRDSCAQDL